MENSESKDETLRSIGEDELIRRIAGWLNPADGPEAAAGSGFEIHTGIGDDTAIVRTHENAPRMALTTDMLVEGVHFLPDCDPEALGAKATVSNLSDLASAGAWPLWTLISFGGPAETKVKWVRALYHGMQSAISPYGCVCLGGDTVRSRDIVINIVAAGALADDVEAPLRTRARPGQSLYVTGTLGDSGAGLKILRGGEGEIAAASSQTLEYLLNRHLRPSARVEAGRAIARSCPDAAMMDLSDGLAQDLPRLARASRCGFEVNIGDIPVSPALREFAAAVGKFPERFALGGGEDYELLFATAKPPEKWLEKVERSGESLLRVTRIGECVRDVESRVRYTDAQGRDVEPSRDLFRHF